MRIEVANALAFGCLKDKSLELPQGLAVVYGANESGKSTWLHVLYFALCGATVGRRTDADRRFEERYKPWFEDEWKVSAVVALDDGRRLEVVQDLRRKTGHVTELTTGKDVTSKFTTSRKAGMPDLTRACGVDRVFFRHVAIVPQGGVLDLLEQGTSTKKGSISDSIRRFLERASAVSGAPEGIADALRRIEAAREALGQEGREGSKPLNIASRMVREAEQLVDKAVGMHKELVSSEMRIKELEAKEQELRSRIEFLRAVLKRANAIELSERLTAAREIANEYPELESGDWADAVETSRQITEARTALISAADEWRSYPDLSRQEIESRLKEIEASPIPEGSDFDPYEELATIRDIYALYKQSKEAFGALEAAAVEAPTPPDIGGATPEQLESLAIRASAEAPPVESTVEEALAAKERQLERAAISRRLSVGGCVVGGLGALVGAAFLVRSPVVGTIVSLMGFGILAASLLAYSRTSSGTRELHRLKMLYGTQVEAAERAKAQISEALEEARELGLPAEKEKLLELAQQWRLYEFAQRRGGPIDVHIASARSNLIDAASQLATGLSRLREVTGLDGLEIPSLQESGTTQAFASDAEEFSLLDKAYGVARRFLEEAAASRDREQERLELERALSARKRFDAAVGAALEAVKRAGMKPPLDPYGELDSLIAALDDADDSLRDRVLTADDLHRKFATLTGGRNLEDLQSEVEQAARSADEAEEVLSESDRKKSGAAARIASASSHDVLEGYADELDKHEKDLAEVSEQLSAERREFEIRFGDKSSEFVDVAGAEEYLEQTHKEYERYKEQAFVLDKTAELLRAAEKKVHMLLAPRMQTVAGELVKEATLSRYDEVFLDDAQPLVRVRRTGLGGESGPPVDADRVSYGTAEQIYLMFRMVVADTAAAKESIPIFMDESTVHADSERLGRLLAILDAAGRMKDPFEKISQVVLFTQETEVAEWARKNLPAENLIELGST
jgi:hypothetical protein